MPGDLTPPTEVLAFLVRTLAPRKLWAWLGEDGREELRYRIALGFRATAEVLRQPAARSRLVSHLEKTSADFQALVKLWGEDAPAVLGEVRSCTDEVLPAHLPELQNKYGAEGLLLALLHEDKTEAIEVWTDAQEGASTLVETTSDSEDSLSSPSNAELDILRKRLARETQKAEHWRSKFKDTKNHGAANEKILRDKLGEQEKLAHDATRLSKAESLRAANFEAKWEAAEKARERAERRARSTQAESESAQQNVKTLRRQLHRLQQINEELRGRLAVSQQEREANKLQAQEKRRRNEKTEKLSSNPSASRLSAAPASQLHKTAKPDGQKIREAIDRNDEAFVATLRCELSTLQTRDATVYKRLMEELRAGEKYYARVLTNQTARVLVDASNVARYDATKKGRLKYLRTMREELRRHDFFPIIFVADASLPYCIDEPERLRAMIANREVLVTASGQQADEVLARQARETGAYVVTNDRNFHFAFTPDFAPPRIGFAIEDGVVLLNDER